MHPRRTYRRFSDWLLIATLLGQGQSLNLATAEERAADSLSGRLVFFGAKLPNDEPNMYRIVSMLPDGSELRTELALEAPLVGSGSVAPDGATIAFDVQDEEPIDGVVASAAIWIKEPDAAPRPLRHSGWITGWHPDGESLLIERLENDQHEDYLIHIASGEIEPVDLGEVTIAQTFIRGGRGAIAIAMNPERSYQDPVRGDYPLRQLVLCDLESGERTVFTDPQHDCIWPAVSPDGAKIAFYLRRHTDRPYEHLAVAEADGTNIRELFLLNEKTHQTSIRPLGFPHWSPDGTEIAWLRTVRDVESNDLGSEIVFVALDGGATRRVPLDGFWGQFDWVE